MTGDKAKEILSYHKILVDRDTSGLLDKKLEYQAIDMAIKALDAEPSTAFWILLDECSNSGYYCSKCQKKVVKEGWSDTVKKIKFCPNCGAKMVEPQKSED